MKKRVIIQRRREEEPQGEGRREEPRQAEPEIQTEELLECRHQVSKTQRGCEMESAGTLPRVRL